MEQTTTTTTAITVLASTVPSNRLVTSVWIHSLDPAGRLTTSAMAIVTTTITMLLATGIMATAVVPIISTISVTTAHVSTVLTPSLWVNVWTVLPALVVQPITSAMVSVTTTTTMKAATGIMAIVVDPPGRRSSLTTVMIVYVWIVTTRVVATTVWTRFPALVPSPISRVMVSVTTKTTTEAVIGMVATVAVRV